MTELSRFFVLFLLLLDGAWNKPWDWLISRPFGFFCKGNRGPRLTISRGFGTFI